MLGDQVDIDDFLRRPLVAHVATNGPSLRPVWFLWEDGALWWLSAQDSILARRIQAGDARLVVVVDSCDLSTGEVVKITAVGDAELTELDRERAMRKFAKYLGSRRQAWDQRFLLSLDDPNMRMITLRPTRIHAKDMSFTPRSPDARSI